LLPGERPDDILEAESVAKLLDDHGAAPGSILCRKTVYTFHARLAPTWQVDRVFLAGDACHLTPPFAGQGMNSGLRDAHNLAWKLAAVVKGQLGPGLLVSYERERREHVNDMISLALRMGRIMGPSTPIYGSLTRLAFHVVNGFSPLRAYFSQMRYKPQPKFRDGFQLPDRQTTRTTLVGRLLPQPRVVTRAGRHVLLDEVLGDGFALLCVTDDPLTFANAADHHIWHQLGVCKVAAVAHDQPAPCPGTITVVSGFPKLPAYRKVNNLVILVRPDRYVAATFPLEEIDHYATAVDRLCRLTMVVERFAEAG
jgi:3-(3-hydroxy-phenyl)propionate hydroxylase